MQQANWPHKLQPKLQRHRAALLGFSLLVIGAFFPLEDLSLRGSHWVEKLLYDAYLCVSLWVLWRASRHCRSASCWAGLDALLLTYSIVPILQFTLRLPRPQASPIEILNGFPSGHAVALFSLAWLIHLAKPPLGKYWFIAAGIIGLSRVASQYHYDYQVIGGAVLGLTLGWWLAQRRVETLLSWRAWQWLNARFRSGRNPQDIATSE